MVTTWGFSFIGFYCFLTLSWICSLSLLKCLIMLSGFLSSNRGNSCLESFGEVILSCFSCCCFFLHKLSTSFLPWEPDGKAPAQSKWSKDIGAAETQPRQLREQEPGSTAGCSCGTHFTCRVAATINRSETSCCEFTYFSPERVHCSNQWGTVISSATVNKYWKNTPKDDPHFCVWLLHHASKLSWLQFSKLVTTAWFWAFLQHSIKGEHTDVGMHSLSQELVISVGCLQNLR